jgi:hypothetical protein
LGRKKVEGEIKVEKRENVRRQWKLQGRDGVLNPKKW